MKKIKVRGTEYNLEEKDAALIEAIQELKDQIRRVADNGS